MTTAPEALHRRAAKAQRTQRKRWLENMIVTIGSPLLAAGDTAGAVALCEAYGLAYDQVLEQERLAEAAEAREA